MQERVMEKIVGTVEEIIFRHADNGFVVLQLSCNDELVTVVGTLPDVTQGEELEIEGYFTTHPNFGKQFRVALYSQRLPATAYAMRKYLSSGTIKGVGPALSRRIVDMFGDNTFKVIQHEHEKLTQIRGISERLANSIYEDFMRLFGVRCIMSSLKAYGLTVKESVLVFHTLGQNTLDCIEQDIYVLTRPDIRIDFEKIDSIALKSGISTDDERRLIAGCVWVVNHNFLVTGHSCLPYNQLLRIATAFLNERESVVEIALSNAIDKGILEFDDRWGSSGYVYLPCAFRAEKYIAKRIAEFTKMSRLRPKRNWDKQIQLLSLQHRVLYDPLQTKAINCALNEGFLILSGGPGTGKTTTLNAIISLYKEQGFKVAIAAPTGRAAKRVQEVTGNEAKTIHRLLEVKVDDFDHFYFARNEENPLTADVVIIDEFSMVDLMLFESLLLALKPTTRLILVGDANQLPSVACGCILSDFMKCSSLPIVELAQVFRQAAKSLIVTNAHDIVMGDMPRLNRTDSDFFFLNEFDRYRAQRTILSLICDKLPEKYGFLPSANIQVLCPGKLGQLGTIALNAILQERLNPPSEEKSQLKYKDVIFRCGDKVMQNKNNYKMQWTDSEGSVGMGVFNGDIGEIVDVDRLGGCVFVEFDDKVCKYYFDMLSEIEHAYAVTVHKSQGSEFDAVILPLMGQHKNLHYRKLLYTAITRAKKLLVIVGEESTVREMVRNNRQNLRYSTLVNFLNEQFEQ